MPQAEGEGNSENRLDESAVEERQLIFEAVHIDILEVTAQVPVLIVMHQHQVQTSSRVVAMERIKFLPQAIAGTAFRERRKQFGAQQPARNVTPPPFHRGLSISGASRFDHGPI